jgi:hypothetical protein
MLGKKAHNVERRSVLEKEKFSAAKRSVLIKT